MTYFAKKSNLKNLLRVLISLSLASVILWFVFKNIDVDGAIKTILSTNIKWILISGLFSIIAHIARGARWKLMMEPLGIQTKIISTTVAVLNGYLANLVFPRAGEVARCASLQKMEGIPVEKSFGVVIAERVFDLLVLMVLIFVNLALEFNRLKAFFADFFSKKLNLSGNLMLYIGVFALVVMAVVLLFLKFKSKILANQYVAKIYAFGLTLWEGFTSVTKLKNPWLFVFYTIAIWLMYYCAAYILFFSMPASQNLTMLAGLTILVMGSIGMAAPTQGGIGTYHYLVGNIVVLYGLSLQDGIVLATFLHATQTIFVIIFGILAMIYSAFITKKDAS